MKLVLIGKNSAILELAILAVHAGRTELEVNQVAELDAGLHLMGQDRPDLVVIHPDFGDTNLRQVLVQLRSSYPELAVVVVGVHNDEAEEISALNHGADDYISSDSSLGVYMARLNHILYKRGVE